MQTVETLNEGLKRAYTLKITAKDIEARVDGEIKKVAPQMKMPDPARMPWVALNSRPSRTCPSRRSTT